MIQSSDGLVNSTAALTWVESTRLLGKQSKGICVRSFDRARFAKSADHGDSDASWPIHRDVRGHAVGFDLIDDRIADEDSRRFAAFASVC